MIVCYHVLERRIYILSKIIKFLKKSLIMSKSNICFNIIFLIEELNLRFADMWTDKIFEISNIYLIRVTYSM